MSEVYLLYELDGVITLKGIFTDYVAAFEAADNNHNFEIFKAPFNRVILKGEIQPQD